MGGINPPIAQAFHRENIERVVHECVTEAKTNWADIDAIAVTNRPGKSTTSTHHCRTEAHIVCFPFFVGLILSLLVGLRYAKHLARKHGKPLIPIHHMEAHALMARLDNDIEFPFLCLLASGGHCLLTICKNVHEFQLLGEQIDDAPGECFDKVARAMRLQNLDEYRGMNGGQAIELAASKSQNPDRFDISRFPLAKEKNCQFSFSGIKSTAIYKIKKALEASDTDADTPIEHYEDLCAGFLRLVTKHMLHRTQRAMEYCRQTGVFEDRPRALVFSGGVACNDFIFSALSQMAEQYGYTCHRPAKKLCTDNGVMIAWNGIERWTAEADSYLNLEIDTIMTHPKCPLAIDLIKDVAERNIAPIWAKVPIMRTNVPSAVAQ